MVGEHQQLVRVVGGELDERLVAVLVLQRSGLAQHAVGHLLQVTLAREHDGYRVLLHLGLQVHLHHIGGRNQARLARGNVLLVHRGKLIADNLLDALFAGQGLVQLFDIAFQLGDVLRAVKDVLLVDVAQLQLCHEFRLRLIDAEAGHQVGNNLHFQLGVADDGDGLVDVQQDGFQAVQQVQAVALLLQLVVDAATGGLNTPGNPFLQYLAHAHNARVAVYQHIEVARERVLQCGGFEQLRHQLFRVYPPFHIDGDAQAGKVGLVADVGDLAHLAFLGKLHDALDDDVGFGGVRNLVHLDDALIGQVAPTRTDLEATGAGAVDALHFFTPVDDLATGGEIGRGQVLVQVAFRIVQEMHGGRANLVQVEATDVGRHGNADALVGGNQDVGECSGQKARLLHGAVVAVHEIHRVFVDILEYLGADGRKLGFGVTAGCIAQVAGIVLAEVALRLHERGKQRFVARSQTHHGFVDGGIAVGVQLHGLAHDVGALLTVTVQQAHLVHGVQQLAVRRLEAVYLGERARNVGAHGVGHVVQFQRLRDGLLGNLGMQADNVGVFHPLLLRFLFRLLCHGFPLVLLSGIAPRRAWFELSRWPVKRPEHPRCLRPRARERRAGHCHRLPY